MKKVVSIAVCVFLLLVGCSTTSAQSDQQPQQAQVSDAEQARQEKWQEKLSESNRAVIKEKCQKIENEIAQLKDHPWAGQYYHGDGLGANVTLTLAPENGFTVTWYGCMGLYDQNHGTVDWDGNRIKLSFAFDVEKNGIGDYATEYKPIRWGERVYLIPANEIVQFCNAINSRRESRNGIHGFFFLRLGDGKKETTGKPELPEEFMPYLLDEPVDAVLTEIIKTETNPEKYCDKKVTVKINKGKKDGLLPGMKLYVQPKPKSFWENSVTYETITLIGGDETQSEGICEYNSKDRWNKAPKAGQNVSTCPSWRR